MATTAKLPNVGYTEIDNSGVLPSQLTGFHGIITPTLFGPTDAPVRVTTLEDFKANFGGVDTMRSPFFPQIKRALQRGVALDVLRLVPADAAAAAIPVGATEWLVVADNFTINAKWKGAWANGKLGIDFTAGSASLPWILNVRYAPNTEIEETFSAATFAELLTTINAWSNLITVTVTGTVVAPLSTTATVFMTLGSDGAWADDTAKTAVVQTALHAFDDHTDLATLTVLGLYTKEHLQNFIEYMENRADAFGLFEVNPSNTPAQALTFLTSVADVSSSFVGLYYGSNLTAYSTDLNKDVAGPIILDVIGVYAYNDTVGARYQAPAGAKRGLIPDTKTFDTNLLSPARVTTADSLVALGCNIVGKHPAFGNVVWGASTFNKGVSAKGPAGTVSALDAVHVRRMLIDLHSTLMPIYQSELFDPQDPKTWRDAYGKVKPILKSMEDARAIYPGWAYIGDQGASRIQDARYNKPADLALGKYKALIPLVPVGFISSINFAVQVNSLLSMFQTEVSDTVVGTVTE